MAGALEAGPYRVVHGAGGLECPWYIVPFDKRGRCTAPETRAHLLGALETGSYTHVFYFSHGWNNDWKTATERYEHFIDGFTKLRRDQGRAPTSSYRPLLIGVIWPSTSLVLPWEKPPQIAADPAASGARDDMLVEDERASVEDIAAELREEDVARFYELVQKRPMSRDDSFALAGLIAPLLHGSDELDDSESAHPEELLQCWTKASSSILSTDDSADDFDDFGTATADAAGPQAAGLFDRLDPRPVIRMTTVWRMKDRAGRVGAGGVGRLLRKALTVSDASFHLIGHSYGCKVMLSAVCHEPLPRPVTSLLLLQPAISCLCFAKNVDGTGRSGGYRIAFDRVEQPVLSTFSRHDYPLTKVFHLAVRRSSDLGEQKIAGLPPNKYAALGGYGPAGCDDVCDTVEIKQVGDPYDLKNRGVEIYGVRGDSQIAGHGEISNTATWWALHQQIGAT